MDDSKIDENVKIEGKPASAGVAIGKVYFLADDKITYRPEKIGDVQIDIHVNKYKKALKIACEDLAALKAEASEDDVRDILDAQIQILNDPELKSLIITKIQKDQFDATYAVFTSFNQYIELFEDALNDRIRERTTDIIALRDMLIQILQRNRNDDKIPEGSIVFSETVSPARMMWFSKTNVEGVVMHKGGVTSHAVILAQSLGIPCVIGVDSKLIHQKNGESVVLDGSEGEVILRPSPSVMNEFEIRKKKYKKRVKNLLRLANLPNQTECGYPFILRANVEFLEELPDVNKMHLNGVGLLRTETLFLHNEHYDVEHQIEFYNKVLESTGSNEVTIRLLDIGGDKNSSANVEESNPFLGWRGIRMLLSEKKLLQNQLKAILTVSGRYPGRVKILVPMVSVLTEIDELKSEIDAVRNECRELGIETDPDIELGLMVEVPAIALMAKQAAQMVDFFSIGTNDLTQYTLAVDRGNERISKLYQPWHPAVWKLIKLTKEGADEAGIPVSVCGEMASNPVMAACLLGLQISELSMNTAALPKVKDFLHSHTKKEMECWVHSILRSNSSEEAFDIVNQHSAVV